MSAEKKNETLITIDGRTLAFEPGETILEVARRNGIYIPTLCHLAGASPTGACRVCVVEIQGARALGTSCTVPCARNMVVRTRSPKVLAARKMVLALLLSSGNHNCAVRRERTEGWTALQEGTREYDGSHELCEVYGNCRLQALAYRYQVDSSQFAGREPEYPAETASPLILRDFSRCILCGRCVQACNEIQVNNAISYGFRGSKAKIIAMGDQDLERSDCVFCGECIQRCPVGALVDRRSRYRARPWEVRHVRTTCAYCGVGCQLDLEIKDDRVVRVNGIEDAQPNLGRLCVQGRFGFDFLTSPRRLARPMVRDNGTLREASWQEALDRVAEKTREIREKHGAEAIGLVCSGKSTNESLYLAQKLFRSVIGTSQITSPHRSTPMTHSLGDIEKAGRILLVGSDVTTENPVAGTFIKRAARAGGELLVIDSAETRIARFARLALKPRPGTEAVLLQGLIRRLLETGRARGFDEERAAAEAYPLEKVSEVTGVAGAEVERLADALRAGGPTMLIYGAKFAAWSDLLVRIQRVLEGFGVEGGGVNALSSLNNSVGAALMGVDPHQLPGYAPLADAEARGRFEKIWGGALSETPGRALPQMLASARGEKQGNGSSGERIRMLFVVGEDLTQPSPGLVDATGALEALDFLVVQDILESPIMEHADVVLPAAAWIEDEGTTINCERRVSRVRRAVPPTGEARPETWILTELARRLGASWPERTSQAIWEEEVCRLVPQVAGVTYARLEREGLQWPVAEGAQEGTPRLDGEPPRVEIRGEPRAHHHRAMLAACEGLTESLSRAEGGTRDWPSDPAEVTRRFEALLKAENCSEKRAEIDRILAAHRERRGGLIPVLQAVQETLGYLAVEAQNYIAFGLGVPAADVFGVTSFYSFFTMVPRGTYTIRVCLGTACYVKGSGKILENLEDHLKIKVGETTPDRMFTLTGVRCVGACGLAPVVVVGEETHGMVDPAKAHEILDKYRSAVHDAS